MESINRRNRLAPVDESEGFSLSSKLSIVLWVGAFFLPMLFSFMKLFSSSFVFEDLGGSFFKLLLKNLFWGSSMAALSAGVTVLLSIPVAVYLSFSQIQRLKSLLSFLNLSALLLFVLPSSAIALFVLALLPESAPEFLQRGMLPVVLAHFLWNHVLLVVLFQNRLQRWLSDSGSQQLDSARTLGARPWNLIQTLILPALYSEISFAAAAIFLGSLVAFGTVLILGGGPGAGSLETFIFYHLFANYDSTRLTVLIPVGFSVNMLFFLLLRRRLRSNPDFGSRGARDLGRSPDSNPFRIFGIFLPLTIATLGVTWFSFFRSIAIVIFQSSSAQWSTLFSSAGLSFALAGAAALFMLPLSLLSATASGWTHFASVLALGISPALLNLSWSESLGQTLTEAPLYARILFSGLIIALSSWPLMDFWINKRRRQIPQQLLEAAATLGASLSQRIWRLRLYYLSDIVAGSLLFAALGAFSDCLISPLYLLKEKPLAVLAQEKAARYEFFETHFFLSLTFFFVFCILYLRSRVRQFRTRRCE